MTKVLFSSLYLVRDVFIHPQAVFEKINNNKIHREVYVVFLIGGVISFLKTFLRTGTKVNFFVDNKFNELFTFLSIPRMSWLIWYTGFFVFIFFLLLACKIINGKVQRKSLTLSLLAISGLGIVFHFLFFPLQLIFREDIIFIFVYLTYLWASVLTVKAISTTQGIAIWKSIICFFIPAVPLTLTALLMVMFPYLAFLTYR